jgi:hypothetical protein
MFLTIHEKQQRLTQRLRSCVTSKQQITLLRKSDSQCRRSIVPTLISTSAYRSQRSRRSATVCAPRLSVSVSISMFVLANCDSLFRMLRHRMAGTWPNARPVDNEWNEPNQVASGRRATSGWRRVCRTSCASNSPPPTRFGRARSCCRAAVHADVDVSHAITSCPCAAITRNRSN